MNDSYFNQPILGPQPPDFTGFPSDNTALQVTNNVTARNGIKLADGSVAPMTVTTAGSPTIPANTTNMSLIAWVFPTPVLTAEPVNAGVVVMGASSSGGMEALCYTGAVGGNTTTSIWTICGTVRTRAMLPRLPRHPTSGPWWPG